MSEFLVYNGDDLIIATPSIVIEPALPVELWVSTSFA